VPPVFQMIKELAYVVRYVLGKDAARRSVSVFPDDTFIVSFPRSGNTWMRFLVSNVVHPTEEIGFDNIDKFVPEIIQESKRYLNSLPRPRVLKSHEYLDLRYPRVIYIVRDPRDVVVSNYYFLLKRKNIDETLSLNAFVDGMLRRRFWQDFGTWSENVGGWLGSRLGTEGFLLIRYEDMLSQPQIELAKVADLLDVAAGPDVIARALEKSNFGEMQKLEKLQSDNWFLTKEGRKDISFIRGGVSGGWTKALSSESVGAIEREWGHWMSFLGYELASGEAPRSPLAAACLSSGAQGDFRR